MEGRGLDWQVEDGSSAIGRVQLLGDKKIKEQNQEFYYLTSDFSYQVIYL